jgi:hypothetical protein
MKRVSFIGLLFILALVLIACPATTTPNPSKTYNLNAVGSSGISGTAKYEKLSGTETKVTLELTGTAAGTYPAHIHVGDIPDGGGIYISLADVNGATGKSEKTITQTDAGEAITYEQLIDYDGYINIHGATAPVAQGETGKDSPYTVYTATLSGANEVPPVTSTATGSVAAKLKGNVLTVKGEFTGLTAPAAAAHIHGPALAGVNAPPLFDLTVPSATEGAITTGTTTITLTAAQITDLQAGKYYVNIHSQGTDPPGFPGGEIRGQLEP